MEGRGGRYRTVKEIKKKQKKRDFGEEQKNETEGVAYLFVGYLVRVNLGG